MEIRISPKLEWMRPYLELGLTFVSKGHIVERLGAWTIGKSRGRGEFAALFQDRIGAPHRIWMHTHYEDSEGKHVPFSKIDLLTHLAHELAHTEDWKHTPKHSALEAKIKIAFMKMLNREGYISEETELNENVS
jgi:hypothetical protein